MNVSADSPVTGPRVGRVPNVASVSSIRGRRPEDRGQVKEGFNLWGLYWGAVALIAVGAFLLAVTAPTPAGTGAGLALGAMLVGLILAHAVLLPLAVWLIGRINMRGVRIMLFLAIPLLVLAAREGWLGESLAWDYYVVATGSTHATASFNDDVQPSRTDLQGAAIACSVVAPAGNVGRGFMEGSKAAGCTPDEKATARLRIELQAGDPFCYVPFYKRATLTYRARLTLEPAKGEPSSIMDIEGSVERKDVAMESCRHFNQELGRFVAQQAMAHYRQMLEKQVKESADQRREREARVTPKKARKNKAAAVATVP